MVLKTDRMIQGLRPVFHLAILEVFKLVTVEIEKDIVDIVENAIEKLNVVKEYAKKENKQIVSDLARDLERIIPMDTICMEIINRLEGHLSPRTIRKYLDEKYKIKYKLKNARKQKNKQSSLAASRPLNKVSETLVIDGRDKILFPDRENIQSNQPRGISSIDSESILSSSKNESQSWNEQKQLSQSQVNKEITECPGCIEKEDKIKELEEAHQKVQQFTIADKIGPSVATEGHEEQPVEVIEFEISKKGWEIRDYFKSKKIKSYDEAIWFSGRINRTTGKIIYFDLGRISQNL